MKIKLFHNIIVSLLLSTCITSAFGQELKSKKNKEDSVKSLHDSPDTSYNQTSNLDQNHIKSVQFYDSLKIKAGRNQWSKQLHSWVVRNPETSNGTTQKQISELPFEKYNGKLIRKIIIRQIDIFGPTVNDTTPRDLIGIERMGNKLHITTREEIIRNKLFIKEGTVLNAFSLADNERFIREQPYIKDAKVVVIENGSPDSVDLLIIVQDLYPLGLDLQLGSLNSGLFSVFTKNIFGFGHEFYNNFHWDANKTPNSGYSNLYRISSIGRSFVTAEFQYRNLFESTDYILNFKRDYFTPDIKMAGGFGFVNSDTKRDVEFIDTVLSQQPVSFNQIDLWISRAFAVNEKKSYTRSNIGFSGRIIHDKYFSRPATSTTTLYDFHNKTILLGSISYSSQGFFRSTLINKFGQTEDIPFGSLINLTFGYEYSEYQNRPYIGIHASGGRYFERLGYLFGQFEFGTFVSDQKMQQGMLAVRARYFTPILSRNRFKYRIFLNTVFRNGINRFLDEYITLSNTEGIIGLVSNSLKGNRTMLFNIEAHAFTPYYLYGFRFVFFTYADIGLIGNSNDLLSNNLYSGLGVGVRIRNERLVFNTLQIRLGFFPFPPEDSKMKYIDVSGEPILRPDNFYIKPPKILDY